MPPTNLFNNLLKKNMVLSRIYLPTSVRIRGVLDNRVEYTDLIQFIAGSMYDVILG